MLRLPYDTLQVLPYCFILIHFLIVVTLICKFVLDYVGVSELTCLTLCCSIPWKVRGWTGVMEHYGAPLSSFYLRSMIEYQLVLQACFWLLQPSSGLYIVCHGEFKTKSICIVLSNWSMYVQYLIV